MNRKFIETEFLPKNLRFVNEFYNNANDYLFFKTYKNLLNKENITKKDLIERNYYLNHINIENFRNEFLKSHRESKEALCLFCKCTHFGWHPSYKEINDKIDFYLELLEDKNVNYLKKLVRGEIKDYGSNLCMLFLICDDFYFINPGYLSDQYIATYATYLPFHYHGILPFLYYHLNKKLYKKAFDMCLELIRKLPEESFSVLISLYQFCCDFDRTNLNTFINSIKENKDVYNYLLKIKGTKLINVPLYGSTFNYRAKLDDIVLDNYLVGYNFYENVREK